MTFPNIEKRLLFVVPAIPIAWWIINASPFSITLTWPAVIRPGHILIIMLAILACWEYIGMLRILYPRNGFWISYIWLVLHFVLNFFDIQLPHYTAFWVLLLLVAIEAFGWGRLKKTRRWMRASLLFSGVAIIYMCAAALLNFYNDAFQHLFRTFEAPMLSQLGICLVILAVCLCDSSAYFIGCSFGKRRFSIISPHKTIEGAIGGFVAAVLTASIGWWFLADFRLPKGLGILLGVLIGIFAQIGDLFVSLMKRYFRVKDSSHLIPGHGGILDRFGSLFFTAPAISIFSWIVGRIIHV
jgi:phosphatidate cytidylyltransferase